MLNLVQALEQKKRQTKEQLKQAEERAALSTEAPHKAPSFKEFQPEAPSIREVVPEVPGAIEDGNVPTSSKDLASKGEGVLGQAARDALNDSAAPAKPKLPPIASRPSPPAQPMDSEKNTEVRGKIDLQCMLNERARSAFVGGFLG